jgi:hypothetical protein
MSKVNVKVEGIEKTLASLKKWQLIKRQAVEDTLKKIGYKVEADTKRGCPVWTGRLRNSMSTNWAGSGMARGKTGGGAAKPDDAVGQPAGEKGLVVVVGSNVSYAHMQEFGSWGDAPKPGPGEPIPKREHEPWPRPPGGFQMLTKAYMQNENTVVSEIGKIMGKDEKV